MSSKEVIVRVLRGERQTFCVWCGETIWSDKEEDVIHEILGGFDDDGCRASWRACSRACAHAAVECASPPLSLLLYEYAYNWWNDPEAKKIPSLASMSGSSLAKILANRSTP